MRVFLIFRMGLVQLLMPFRAWSSIFLIPEQPLLIPFPLFRIRIGGVIPVPEVLELLRFMMFWTMLCLCWLGHSSFSCLFLFCFQEVLGGLGITLPLLYNFKDSVPPSEACLYDHIKWSLAKVQQQSSLGLSQSATSL